MAFSQEKINQIYTQIDDFNNQKVAKNVTVCDEYYYVNTDDAKDSSEFFKFIKTEKIKAKSFDDNVIIDLAFGSGNLTSHLVLDNIEDFDKIVFNDISDKANLKLVEEFEDKAELLQNDFKDANVWDSDKGKIIVFNPLIGGQGEGGSELEKIPVIIDNNSFEEYLKEKGVDTSELNITEQDYRIDVHSDTLNKTPLKNLLKGINIFNYKDVFYQSKSSKVEGHETNTVKFRATFDKVFDENGIAVFYGDDDAFNSLFADFNTVYKYKRDSKNLYIAIKQGEVRTINEYCKTTEGFEICKEETKGSKSDSNIAEIQSEIGITVEKLAKTTQDEESIATQNKDEEKDKEKTEPFIIDISPEGKLDFPYKNILLKGVPGTGKSRLIDVKLLKKIGIDTITHPNILRLNIHSASSNSDLMQGIGVSANNGNIEYNEKQGLILNHLKNAISKPKQAFAIILEEIQENNLNELIGDLIYLIEDEKRTNVVDFIKDYKGSKEFESFDAFVNALIEAKPNTHYVQIPYLVSSKTKYRKLILPKNLYFFCTSNYRDDKKIIEDNLLRRFDLIELYPKSNAIRKNDKDEPKQEIKDKVADFLDVLNNSIIKHFKNKEIHPDRLLIGHAYWITVTDVHSFYRALLKSITEFKDIREIEFSDIKPVLDDLMKIDSKEIPFGKSLSLLKGDNYKSIINKLQKIAYNTILNSEE